MSPNTTRENSANSGNNEKCPQCMKEIHSNDQTAIGCEGSCNAWFHKDCIGLTETEAKVLRGRKGNLLWMCGKCRPLLEAFGVTTQPLELTEIREATMESKETCKEIRQKLDEIESTLLQKMSLLLEAQLQQSDHVLKFKVANEKKIFKPEHTISEISSNEGLQTMSEIPGKEGLPVNTSTSMTESLQATSSLIITYAEAINTPPTAMTVNMDNSHKQPQQAEPQPRRTNRNIIRGARITGSTDLLTGNEWIYVGGLHENTEGEKLINFMKTNGIGERSYANG